MGFNFTIQSSFLFKAAYSLFKITKQGIFVSFISGKGALFPQSVKPNPIIIISYFLSMILLSKPVRLDVIVILFFFVKT